MIGKRSKRLPARKNIRPVRKKMAQELAGVHQKNSQASSVVLKPGSRGRNVSQSRSHCQNSAPQRKEKRIWFGLFVGFFLTCGEGPRGEKMITEKKKGSETARC